MQRKFVAPIALSLMVVLVIALTAPVVADTIGVDFETYTLGNVNGQDGWSKTGPYDVAVVANTYGYTSFGTQSLRISNAVTSGSFGDQTFSKPTVNEAGETTAANGGMSGGVRQKGFIASWDFASTVPGAEQAGLAITASPDRGDGARMSWIQMADTPGGLDVNFYGYDTTNGGTCSDLVNFEYYQAATGLDRTVPHNIRAVIQFVDGVNNDVVKLYVDGALVHTATTWEDYFRNCEPPDSRTVDSILFRASGTAAPATSGNGFLIDNLSITTCPGIVTNVNTGEIFCSIQAAIDDSDTQNGHTIDVGPGTYVEQVEVDKELTIQGAGAATVIQSPSGTLPLYFATSVNNYPIVYVHGVSSATIKNLVVDGGGNGNANYRFSGIAFRNAGGTVDSVEVKNIRDTPFSGSQHGVAIYAYNDDAIARTITVKNSNIHDFQKNAMALNAGTTTPLTVNVQGNTIVGAGPTTITAQNGIQVWADMGTGVVTNNNVSGIGYDNTSDPTKWVGSSILDYYADVDITANTVTGAQVGVYFIDASGDIQDNDITVNQIGNGGMWGIIATDPPNAVPSPFGGEELLAATGKGPEAASSTLTVDVSDNTVTFSGGSNISTFGIEADAGFGPQDIAVTADNNLVTGFEVGIEFYQCQSSCDTGVFTAADAFGNSVAGNNIGMRSNLTYLTVDASGNWWGSNAPATVAGQVSGNIDYTPWLNTGTNSASGTGFEGDFSNLWVDDNSPQTGAIARIQEGVDLVTASIVNVAAGTYTENVLANKSVELRGAQYGNSVSGRTAGAGNESTVNGLITVDSSTVTIDGFTLTNPGQTYAVYVNSHTPSYSTITIGHNLIDAVGSPTLTSNVHAILVNRGPDSVTISDNSFNNVSADNKSVSGVGILDSASTDPSSGLVIANNTFSNISSATKGAYGIIVNNAAGAPGAQILNNTFSGLSGGWTHAVGLEGPTPNAIVTDNIFSGLTAAGADKSAVFFEKNPTGGTVTVQCNLFNGATFYGVALHPNDLPGGSNGYNYVATAEKNWWNDASGPYNAVSNPSGTGALVGPNVDFDPWLPTNTSCASGTGNWQNTRTGAYDDLQDSLDNALPGDTILAVGNDPLSGGATADQPGVTIDLNGKTAGPGSPFLIVNAANITVNGPGTLDGWTGTANSTSPAILVNSGGDNFILDGVQVKRWEDGVELAGSVTSFKLVNNWINLNTDAGLQVNSGVTLGGVVTIQGNLFKVNGGNGVQNNGATANLNVEYNSWGDVAGPTGTLGDNVGGSVDYDPWTFAETYLDVDPTTGGDQYQRNVNESTSFDVNLNVEAANLYGLAFQFTYDPNYLTLSGPPTFSAPWSSSCFVVGMPPAGTFKYQCYLTSGPAWNGGTVATFNFTANGVALTGDGPWTTYFDISHLETNTSAGASGGVKVFVNNAGFNAPTTPDRDITDANDGQIDITGIAQFTGFVDLQGRPNDSGAVMSVFSGPSKPGTAIAAATSASSGAYTTAYIGANLLTVGTTYYLYFDRPLYLPTTADAASLYAHSKLLSTRPTTPVNTFVLLGGDATDDNLVDINDATCIGNQYGLPAAACGVGGLSSSDVNGDGTTNILDLVLFGGNYLLSASPWTP